MLSTPTHNNPEQGIQHGRACTAEADLSINQAINPFMRSVRHTGFRVLPQRYGSSSD
jgi:hypothetical protein